MVSFRNEIVWHDVYQCDLPSPHPTPSPSLCLILSKSAKPVPWLNQHHDLFAGQWSCYVCLSVVIKHLCLARRSLDSVGLWRERSKLQIECRGGVVVGVVTPPRPLSDRRDVLFLENVSLSLSLSERSRLKDETVAGVGCWLVSDSSLRSAAGFRSAQAELQTHASYREREREKAQQQTTSL